MKIYEMQLFFALAMFAGIAVALGWCSKEVALLIVIIQLLASIVALLLRIYDAIVKYIAFIISKENEATER